MSRELGWGRAVATICALVVAGVVASPAHAIIDNDFFPGRDRPVFGDNGEIVPVPTPIPPPDFPEPTPESLARPGISIGARGAHELTIEWCDNSSIDQGNNLYRSEDGGPFELVEDLGADPRGCRSYVDDGAEVGDSRTSDESRLRQDTQYCYQIAPVKDFAEWADYLSVVTCAYTREVITVDGRNGEDEEVSRPIWRAQLELRTANRKHAGTDDPVNVALNSPAVGWAYRDTIPVRRPFGNNTWLDYGGDDRERGTTELYDLNLISVSEIGDITRIAFKQDGGDQWCLDGFSLIVNSEAEVFRKDFSPCLKSKDWGHLQMPFLIVGHQELREHPLWHDYVPELVDIATAAKQLGDGEPVDVLTIPRGELESRIEGMVGHQILGRLKWGHLDGPRYVEVARIPGDDSRVSVDLDLKVPAPGFDPEVDIAFDLHFGMSCRDDESGIDFTIATENFDVDADANWLTEALGWLWCQTDITCEPQVERFIEKEIRRQLTPIAQQISFDTDSAVTACKARLLPVARVTPASDLAIEIHPPEVDPEEDTPDDPEPEDPLPYGPVRDAFVVDAEIFEGLLLDETRRGRPDRRGSAYDSILDRLEKAILRGMR